jgi:hypothetical protein
MDSLVDEGRLFAKDYNKQKIYCVSQSLFEAPTSERLAELEAQCEKVRAEAVAARQEVAALEAGVFSIEFALFLHFAADLSTWFQRLDSSTLL